MTFVITIRLITSIDIYKLKNCNFLVVKKYAGYILLLVPLRESHYNIISSQTSSSCVY